MQSFWDITFELLTITQFFHPFISVYIRHLILQHVSQNGRLWREKTEVFFLGKFLHQWL